jgi:glycerophosphoryl diester phosphodiesterase
MKVIGHRGAAGLALENTLESIKAAKLAGVDAIEFDVRLTADGQFVLCHDTSVSRVSTHTHVIKEVVAEHIGDIILLNGESLPTLSDALDIAGDTPVVIETKGSDWATPLEAFFKQNPHKNASVISFDHDELSKFVRLTPQVSTYPIENTRPFDVIQLAKHHNFTGIDMNFWILNPLTYFLARRKKLEIIVYTVNSRWIAVFLSILFPRISITTDHPNQMQFLRRHIRKVKSPAGGS